MMRPPDVIRFDKLGPLTIPLHGLHAMALAYGEEQFKRYGRCHPTFALAFSTDVGWLEPDRSYDTRAETFHFMRSMLSRVQHIRAYSFITEVWVASRREGTKRSDLPDSLADLPPSERDEKLWVDSWNRSGDHFHSWYLITPRRKGLAFLGPRVDGMGGYAQTGRALNLFAPVVPDPPEFER